MLELMKKTGEIKGYAIYNVKKSDSPLKAINLDIPKSICEGQLDF